MRFITTFYLKSLWILDRKIKSCPMSLLFVGISIAYIVVSYVTPISASVRSGLDMHTHFMTIKFVLREKTFSTNATLKSFLFVVSVN